MARVHDGDGGRRQVWRSGFRTKAEALSQSDGSWFEAEDDANQVPDTPAQPVSPKLEVFLTDWLEHSAYTPRPTTSVLYDKLVRQDTVPHLGTITLAALAPADIRSWHATLWRKPKRWGGAPLSPTTVRTMTDNSRKNSAVPPPSDRAPNRPCDRSVPRRPRRTAARGTRRVRHAVDRHTERGRRRRSMSGGRLRHSDEPTRSHLGGHPLLSAGSSADEGGSWPHAPSSVADIAVCPVRFAHD